MWQKLNLIIAFAEESNNLSVNNSFFQKYLGINEFAKCLPHLGASS